MDAFRCIVRDEGFFALYRGIGTALTLVSNGALQFMAYEQVKELVVSNLPAGSTEDDLTSLHFLSMGAVAKIFSSSVTYPLQVTKSRLYQRQSASTSAAADSSVMQIWKQMLQKEGIRSFYRGIKPQLIKTAPSSALTFLAYEHTMRFFRRTFHS